MAEITGKIVGAYRDEAAFILDGAGSPVGITDILNMILTGGAEADGNGIYSGSGNVPDFTIATATGFFTIRHDNDGSLIFGDNQGAEQAYIYKNDRTLGMTNYTADNESDLVVNPTSIVLESNTSAPDQSSGQITIAPDTVSIKGENSVGNIVEIDVTGKTVKLINLPNYVDDAAADADGTLPSDGLYTTTGARTIKIKP